jgi:hypothetical protein
MTTVITITVKEPKGKGRPIIVSAAPEGEMPIILTGLFQDRHTLLDEIWVQLLTRKPQVVKVAAEKKVAAAKDAPTEFPDEAEKDEDATPAPEEKPDQLVRPADAEGLPIIEGDEDPAA